MADARLRGAWLGKLKFDNLSDAAWRVFTSALMWSVEQGTDGRIPTRYLKFLHPDGEQPDAISELVEGGFAVLSPDCLELVDWSGELGQSTNEQVEAYKQKARERMRRRRQGNSSEANREGETSLAVSTGESLSGDSAPPNVPANVRPNIPGYVGPGPGKGINQQDESRFCDKHPGGTDEPCGPCRERRLLFEDRQKAERERPTVSGIVTDPSCPKHDGYPAPNSRWGCPRCDEEQQEAAA